MSHRDPSSAAPPRETTASRVVARLRDDVLTGRRPPGAPVREEHVAEELGVSRHTVRNAFAQLTAQRLLVAAPFRGVRVTEFSYPQAAELQLMRSAIEGEAVRTLQERYGTRRWPTAVTAEADAVVQELLALDDADTLRIQETHSRLHLSVVAAAGSERLLQTYAGLDAEVRLLLAQQPRHYSIDRLVREHRRYLRELPSRGADAVREHMMASLATLFPEQPRG